MDRIEINMLLDFYGQLLTKRTQSILELHFFEDMSFVEIGEQEDISRQAVHDTIKRGVKSLKGFEEKLKLVQRFNSQKQMILLAVEALKINKAKEAESLLIHLLNEL